ncbi:MAG: NAD(P)/FAD-dependent oxidoreductase [Proteobacteria bacterium]|nr:NAD(P)/FAD-dependent oxidoreductase [Pseudomonadota bacterium]
MSKARDRELGMDRPITRRNFLEGMAVATAGGASLGGTAAPTHAAPGDAGYPPVRLGERGQNPGANRVMHAIRDGEFWLDAPDAEQTAERYDLVVVGAGISGLAAALLYRQRVGNTARILILDPLDDFGGHARRNEFRASNGAMLIGYGGSQSLQTPSYFSPAVKALLRDLNLDLTAFKSKYYDEQWHSRHGLESAYFLPKEKFGSDALVKVGESAADWVPDSPFPEKVKADLIQLLDNPPDYLAGKSREEKFELLSRTTYKDFLLNIAKVDALIADLYQESTTDYFGVGIDATTALDAWGNWNPGFTGMDLGDKPYKTMSPSGRLVLTDPDPYIYHFPDGNHGVARALLRALHFRAMPARAMEDLVTTSVNYAALDEHDSRTRIRLNSTVVKVRHAGDPATASSVDVTYANGGKLYKVSAGHVVLACWNRVIPYLTDELSEAQATALKDQQKVPLIYTNVQIKDWRAFNNLKIDGFRSPGHFWRGAEIDFPVSMGRYRFAQRPSDPMILHMAKVPLGGKEGDPARTQAYEGRKLMQGYTFEQMEREIRDLLGRALGGGGFDPARDVEGIAINRWAHGYAYEYMRPTDTFWPDGPLPIEAARKGWGRIAIANSDSGAYAYAHSAIDQAVRAVRELVGAAEGAPSFSDFPGPPRNRIGL